MSSGPSTNARASRARSARPASVTVSRTASPAISAPAFPARPHPGNHAGRRADTPGWTPDSAANVKPGHPPERAPEPRQAATHTAPWPRFPSAMRPWMPQHSGLQRPRVTHAGTEQKRPLAREFAASGAFSQVVAGVGVRTNAGWADGFTARSSYPRTVPLTSAYALRGVFAGFGRPLCVRGHRVPGPLKSTDGARTAGAGAVTLTVLPGFWPLTCHFRLTARCRRRLHRRGPALPRECRGRRRCARPAPQPIPHLE